MIKIGVIGAGHLGKIHLKLLNSSKKFDLIGFYDIDKKSSEELSKKEGYNYFSNLDSLLSNVDAVDIVSPTTTHFQIAKFSLENKKHVLCEKPFAMNADEVKSMVETSKANNVALLEGMWTRYLPPVSYTHLTLPTKA